MWECGLKRYDMVDINWLILVTPYVGVWIETNIRCVFGLALHVTPYVGVWIETWQTVRQLR